MEHTDHGAAHAVLADLVSVLQLSLEDDLVGVYLYGSLATGDFVDGRSDIDLLMVLEQPVSQALLSDLVDIHERFDAEHRPWHRRIDVAYVGRSALWDFRTDRYEAIVSDDEQLLTVVAAPAYYLIDWFKVQDHGTVLSGPRVGEIMPRISGEEFTRAVVDYLQTWPDFAAQARRRGEQAYAVLTACRSLYACRFAAPASKGSGAAWAMSEYPQWRGLIQRALDWNRDDEPDDVPDDHEHRATMRFVDLMVSEALT